MSLITQRGSSTPRRLLLSTGAALRMTVMSALLPASKKQSVKNLRNLWPKTAQKISASSGKPESVRIESRRRRSPLAEPGPTTARVTEFTNSGIAMSAPIPNSVAAVVFCAGRPSFPASNNPTAHPTAVCVTANRHVSIGPGFFDIALQYEGLSRQLARGGSFSAGDSSPATFPLL